MGKTIPVCCGIDVHKTFLVATILMGDYLIPQCKQKHFGTSYRNLIAFRQWLLDNNCKDVCMESTGKYWVPVWNALEGFVHVVIANPKWVSAVKGNKDDKKDSKWIGNLFRMGLVPGSYIPVKDIRILRECTRYRSKLVSMRSSEKNRFQNAFTVCNLTLDAVVSDMFGKSAKAMKNLIEENDLPPVVFHSLRHSSITYKLKLTGGDIKAVQGDSGHAQAAMVTDQYSHILDENRCTNAELIEKAFYAGKGSEPDASSDGKKKIAEAAETEKQESVSPEQLAKLLTNPEVINMLKVLSKTIGN